MEIFIGNLSAEAKLIEIHHILGAFEMHSDFSTHEGKNCDHSRYHFVVVNTKNEQEAEKLIKRLNGFEFEGRQLDVREYIHRSELKKEQESWQGEDRRINDQLALPL